MNDTTFPSLQQILEKSTTIEEVWKNYIDELRKQPSIYNVFYANKLEEFRRMLSVEKLRELEQEFQDVKEYLRTISKEYGIRIQLKRRQKTFISINQKIRLYLLKGLPLDRINDLLGFRIVLCTGTKDNAETVRLCYKIMNELIEYFVMKRGCLLTEAEPILTESIETNKDQDIFIPKTRNLIPGFENNVKDYISTPKNNGYQGLHTIVRKPDGLVFEIQIRTMAMDIRSEYGCASHYNYKAEKYEAANIDLDFSKVQIQGFKALENGEIYDSVFLIKSGDPFNLL